MAEYDVTQHAGLSATAKALVEAEAEKFAFEVRVAAEALGLSTKHYGTLGEDAIVLQVNDQVGLLTQTEGGRLVEEKRGKRTFRRAGSAEELALNPTAKRIADRLTGASSGPRPAAAVQTVSSTKPVRW